MVETMVGLGQRCGVGVKETGEKKGWEAVRAEVERWNEAEGVKG